MAPKLSLTPRAALAVRRLRAAEDRPDETFLRFRLVVGEGPSGFTFRLEFDDVPRPGDRRIESHGVPLAIDAESWTHVETSVLTYAIDYQEGPAGSGFLVTFAWSPDEGAG